MRLKIREILWRSFHKSPSEITNGNMAAVQEMWREAVPLHSTLLTWLTPTRTFESKRDVSLISYYIDRCSFGGRLWDKHRLFKQFFPTWSSWEHIKVLLFFSCFEFCFALLWSKLVEKSYSYTQRCMIVAFNSELPRPIEMRNLSSIRSEGTTEIHWLASAILIWLFTWTWSLLSLSIL